MSIPTLRSCDEPSGRGNSPSFTPFIVINVGSHAVTAGRWMSPQRMFPQTGWR